MRLQHCCLGIWTSFGAEGSTLDAPKRSTHRDQAAQRMAIALYLLENPLTQGERAKSSWN